jgi:hypothetical protein
MSTGNEPRKVAPRDGAEGEDHAALVARLRDELEAARHRVGEAWAQYEQRAADENTREAVALPPLLTALFGLVS